MSCAWQNCNVNTHTHTHTHTHTPGQLHCPDHWQQDDWFVLMRQRDMRVVGCRQYKRRVLSPKCNINFPDHTLLRSASASARSSQDTDPSCPVPISTYCCTVRSHSTNVTDRRTDVMLLRSMSHWKRYSNEWVTTWIYSPSELDTGRVDPRVGSGWVGSDRVGSQKSDPCPTLLAIRQLRRKARQKRQITLEEMRFQSLFESVSVTNRCHTGWWQTSPTCELSDWSTN